MLSCSVVNTTSPGLLQAPAHSAGAEHPTSPARSVASCGVGATPSDAPSVPTSATLDVTDDAQSSTADAQADPDQVHGKRRDRVQRCHPVSGTDPGRDRQAKAPADYFKKRAGTAVAPHMSVSMHAFAYWIRLQEMGWSGTSHGLNGTRLPWLPGVSSHHVC